MKLNSLKSVISFSGFKNQEPALLSTETTANKAQNIVSSDVIISNLNKALIEIAKKKENLPAEILCKEPESKFSGEINGFKVYMTPNKILRQNEFGEITLREGEIAPIKVITEDNVEKTVNGIQLGKTAHYDVYETLGGEILKINTETRKLASKMETTFEFAHDIKKDTKYTIYTQQGPREYNIEDWCPLEESKSDIMNIMENTVVALEFFDELGVQDENLSDAIRLGFFGHLVQMAKKGEVNADIIRAYNTVSDKYHALSEESFSKHVKKLKNEYFKRLSETGYYINNNERVEAFLEVFEKNPEFLGIKSKNGVNEFEKLIHSKNKVQYTYTTGERKGQIVDSEKLRSNLCDDLNKYFESQSSDFQTIRNELGEFGITPVIRKKKIIGFEGMMDVSRARSLKHPYLKEILGDFYFAEVKMQNASDDLNNTLNQILKAYPELKSNVGEYQEGHSTTIDTHTFYTLSKVINDEKFENLTTKMQKVMIHLALLHDCASEENCKNHHHTKTGFTYANNILKGLQLNGANLTDDEIDLIGKMIYYHEWFVSSIAQNSKIEPNKANAIISFLISKDSKLQVDGEKVSAKDISNMLNIFADADITRNNKQLRGRFEKYLIFYHEKFDKAYDSYKYSTLRQASPEYNFDDSEKFKKVLVDDTEFYIVIDENQPLAAHMTRDMSTMLGLVNADYSDIQSASIITSKDNGTAWGLNYGFLLKYEDTDVFLESSRDLDSGYNKNIFTSVTDKHPENVRDTMEVALSLDIGDSENNFAKLKKNAENLGVYDQEVYNNLSEMKKIEILGRLIEKSNISTETANKALKNKLDERNRNQNELLINNPKIAGVVIRGTEEGFEADIDRLSHIIKFANNKGFKIVYLPRVI